MCLRTQGQPNFEALHLAQSCIMFFARPQRLSPSAGSSARRLDVDLDSQRLGTLPRALTHAFLPECETVFE